MRHTQTAGPTFTSNRFIIMNRPLLYKMATTVCILECFVHKDNLLLQILQQKYNVNDNTYIHLYIYMFVVFEGEKLQYIIEEKSIDSHPNFYLNSKKTNT